MGLLWKTGRVWAQENVSAVLFSLFVTVKKSIPSPTAVIFCIILYHWDEIWIPITLHLRGTERARARERERFSSFSYFCSFLCFSLEVWRGRGAGGFSHLYLCIEFFFKKKERESVCEEIKRDRRFPLNGGFSVLKLYLGISSFFYLFHFLGGFSFGGSHLQGFSFQLIYSKHLVSGFLGIFFGWFWELGWSGFSFCCGGRVEIFGESWGILVFGVCLRRFLGVLCRRRSNGCRRRWRGSTSAKGRWSAAAPSEGSASQHFLLHY